MINCDMDLQDIKIIFRVLKYFIKVVSFFIQYILNIPFI